MKKANFMFGGQIGRRTANPRLACGQRQGLGTRLSENLFGLGQAARVVRIPRFHGNQEFSLLHGLIVVVSRFLFDAAHQHRAEESAHHAAGEQSCAADNRQRQSTGCRP
jgi:hypothetical protein